MVVFGNIYSIFSTTFGIFLIELYLIHMYLWWFLVVFMLLFPPVLAYFYLNHLHLCIYDIMVIFGGISGGILTCLGNFLSYGFIC